MSLLLVRNQILHSWEIKIPELVAFYESEDLEGYGSLIFYCKVCKCNTHVRRYRPISEKEELRVLEILVTHGSTVESHCLHLAPMYITYMLQTGFSKEDIKRNIESDSYNGGKILNYNGEI